MELCLRIGGMTLTEMRARMDPTEYHRWMGYKLARQQRNVQLQKSKKSEVPW
jgi:hypothetical protein